MDAAAIRDELRQGRSPSLRRRRRIVALAALGLVDFAVISLYQTGVIRHLPDPPGRLFDSDRVNASRLAYAFGVPDGATGAALYAAILILASAGGSRRTGRTPALDLLLGAAVTLGALAAARYGWEMATRQLRACPYCLVGAAVNFSMLPPAWTEARAALRDVRRSHPLRTIPTRPSLPRG